MAISIDQLQAAARRRTLQRSVQTISEARSRGLQTAFLSHSHRDRELALGLQQVLNEQGWKLYIDWLDGEMPNRPTAETANRIQEKILSTDWFIFLVTANSTASRWCPWELGYADGKKSRARILIVATEDRNGTQYGNEYLSLYRQVSKVAHQDKYALFEANSTQNGTYVDVLLP